MVGGGEAKGERGERRGESNERQKGKEGFVKTCVEMSDLLNGIHCHQLQATLPSPLSPLPSPLY